MKRFIVRNATLHQAQCHTLFLLTWALRTVTCGILKANERHFKRKQSNSNRKSSNSK